VQGADEGRFRTGLAFLVLGISLILWAWGNWLYRASTPEPAASIVRAEGDAVDTVRVEATSVLPQILMYSLILVFLVLFGGYAVVRMVRRYRESADRERAGPSASQDVWAMHKLPDYDRDEDRVK
jgi:TRAP-type C4-dicarboxylate transport system permease small subunit